MRPTEQEASKIQLLIEIDPNEMKDWMDLMISSNMIPKDASHAGAISYLFASHDLNVKVSYIYISDALKELE